MFIDCPFLPFTWPCCPACCPVGGAAQVPPPSFTGEGSAQCETTRHASESIFLCSHRPHQQSLHQSIQQWWKWKVPCSCLLHLWAQVELTPRATAGCSHCSSQQPCHLDWREGCINRKGHQHTLHLVWRRRSMETSAASHAYRTGLSSWYLSRQPPPGDRWSGWRCLHCPQHHWCTGSHHYEVVHSWRTQPPSTTMGTSLGPLWRVPLPGGWGCSASCAITSRRQHPGVESKVEWCQAECSPTALPATKGCVDPNSWPSHSTSNSCFMWRGTLHSWWTVKI